MAGLTDLAPRWLLYAVPWVVYLLWIPFWLVGTFVYHLANGADQWGWMAGWIVAGFFITVLCCAQVEEEELGYGRSTTRTERIAARRARRRAYRDRKEGKSSIAELERELGIGLQDDATYLGLASGTRGLRFIQAHERGEVYLVCTECGFAMDIWGDSPYVKARHIGWRVIDGNWVCRSCPKHRVEKGAVYAGGRCPDKAPVEENRRGGYS